MFAALTSASCSVIGVKRLDPELGAGEQPDCTSSWTLPLFDAGLTAAAGSAAVLFHAGASSKENDGESPTSFRVAGWTAVGVAVAFIASGAYGAYQRRRCRSAEIAYENATPPDLGDRPLKGSQGASCKQDSDCDEDLLCGEPMKTCVPANPPDQPTP
jgi:hypothetical protein